MNKKCHKQYYRLNEVDRLAQDVIDDLQSLQRQIQGERDTINHYRNGTLPEVIDDEYIEENTLMVRERLIAILGERTIRTGLIR